MAEETGWGQWVKSGLRRGRVSCILAGMFDPPFPAFPPRRPAPDLHPRRPATGGRRNTMKNTLAPLVLVPVVLLALLSLKGCYTVDAGVVGVKTQWGKIVGGPVDPGLTWVNPIGGDLVKYDCREQRIDLRMDTYTKDVQTSAMSVTVT